MAKMDRTYAPGRNHILPTTTGNGGDVRLDDFWDANADKYKCCCRTLHVVRASLFIAYAQMLITFVFALFFTFYYVQAINGRLTPDHWINQLGERYISSLLFAVTLQLFLVLLLVHGIRTERRSLLLPFIVFALIAILLGFAQIANDFYGFFRHRLDHSPQTHAMYDSNQFFSHLIGTMVQLWCVAVVWRCYGFLGDKKVVRHIGEQLSTTHVAFRYGDIPHEYIAMSQPPPYADTVISADKQPLTTQ